MSLAFEDNICSSCQSVIAQEADATEVADSDESAGGRILASFVIQFFVSVQRL